MAEIFRSKEIYKHIRDTNNNSLIVPVRNMYVAGPWLTPVYMDHCCTIVSMKSNTPTIGDYTTASTNQTDKDGHLNIVKVDANSHNQKIAWYTTASTSSTDRPGHLNIVKVDASLRDQKITWYYKSTENPIDHPGHLNIITVDVPSTRPSLIIYDNIREDIGHDFGVAISSMTSTEPVIVDS